MKITKGRLKTIIEEEIKAMREVVASDSMHGGPQMTSGGGSVLNAAAEALGMSPDELLRSIAAEYDVDIELEREDEDADPVGAADPLRHQGATTEMDDGRLAYAKSAEEQEFK